MYASPAPASRTAVVLQQVDQQLAELGHDVSALAVRDLPARALLAADSSDPALAAAVELVADAAGIVIGTPIYKAAYSGLLKVLLDVLPERALAGKVVLPVATGGSPAHLLAIDYTLRPVLSAMGAAHIVPGYFAHGSALPGGTRSLRACTEVFSAALESADAGRGSPAVRAVAPPLSPAGPR
ncbi:MAG TPA: NADPH-dependent FMN reductase [Kineosporiaceae bacterium]